MTQWEFQAPPGWPVPPAGWRPWPGWLPDPAWPPPPAGWQFWRPAEARPPVALAPAKDASPATLPARGTLIRELIVVGMIFPLPFIASAVERLVEAAAGVSAVRLPEVVPGHPATSALLLALPYLAGFAPAAAVWYLLGRSGETMRDIGLDASQPGQDALRALLLLILAFILSAAVTNVISHQIPHASYFIALGQRLKLIYLLPGLTQAVWAGIVEETVVAGYLLHRLEQLGVARIPALLISTGMRTSYHLYYGIAVLGVVPFGLLFGWMWQRTHRLAPLIAAHVAYDGLLIGLGVAFSA